MATGSLDKLTVPLPQGQTSSYQGLLMPKLQYRFRVTFTSFGNGVSTELTKQVIDVQKPQIAFENIVLDIYNSKVNIAGKHSWEPVTINLREDITNNVQQMVGEQIQKQFDFYEQSQAAAGMDYKFTTYIQQLDGGNGDHFSEEDCILDTFTLYGCYIENVNYNTLNYATSEPLTISLTIRYDNALQDDQSGIGADVGRLVGSVASSLSTG